MPSSMIPILIPWPALESVGAPERRRADLLRAAVEEPRVADARIDAGDARNGGEPRDLVARDEDGEAVRDDAVAPADLCLRQRGLDPLLERILRRGERAEVGAGVGGARLSRRPPVAASVRPGRATASGSASSATTTSTSGSELAPSRSAPADAASASSRRRQEKGDPAHGRPG